MRKPDAVPFAHALRLARLLCLAVMLLTSSAASAAWTASAPGREAAAIGGRPTLLALPGTGSNATPASAAPRTLVVADEMLRSSDDDDGDDDDDDNDGDDDDDDDDDGDDDDGDDDDDKEYGLRFIDADAGTQLGTMRFSREVVALAVNSTGTHAYVATDNGRLISVAIGTRTVVSNRSLNGTPTALLIKEDAGAVTEILVALTEADQVISVDPATGNIVRTLTLERDPTAMAWAQQGQRLLVGTDRGKVLTVDPLNLTVTQTAQAGDEVRSISWWPSGAMAAVVHEGEDGVSLLNIDTGQVSSFIPLSGNPDQTIIDALNERTYVATRSDFGLNRIKLAGALLEGRYALGERARGTVFDAASQRILLTQRGSGSLLRIDPIQAR